MKSSLKSSMSGAKSNKNRRQLTILGKDGKALNTPSNQGQRQLTNSKKRPLESEVLDYESQGDEVKPLSYRSLKVYYP